MGRFQLVMEQIKFQSDAFKKELELVFENIRQEGRAKAKLEDSESATHLAKVIKNHTGLNFTTDFGVFGPMVEVPMLNKNNPLVNESMKDWINSSDGLKIINETSGSAVGKVNLRNGMVSGVYANEMTNKLYMPVEILRGKQFTDGELAAIVLHEVGHIWTYCCFMAHMVRTNRVLAGLARTYGSAKTPDERELVLVSVKKALKIDIDAKSLALEKSNTVVEYVIVTNVAREAQDEFGANIYDLNTWEMLSDQYAARHGAGADLVTALQKLYRGNISFRNTIEYVSMEALKAGLLVGSFVLPAAGGFFGGLAGSLSIQAAFALIAMDGMGDGTYDRPGMRLKRIRNQIVEAMKEKNISTEYGQRLSEDLMAVDEVLSQVTDREQVAGMLWNIFSRDSRKRLSQEKLAGELEALASNDLFAKSLQFRQLAAKV